MHQLAVFFALFHAADKALVDLQQGNRQAVEVHKRRKTGAEIIQGKPHTQPAKGVHGLLDQVAAAHHGGFGQFELQPLRFHAALGNQAAEGRQQLTVLELAKRQVDRHVQRRQAAFTQVLHVAQSSGDHPVAQWHDQTTLFGQRHEFARRQQAAFTVAPAHQSFEANDMTIVQVQSRLVMQLQLIATQSPAQFTFQVGQAARVAVDAFIEDMKGTALGAFGLLHGDMGMPHQRVGASAGSSMGHAQAATDQQAFAIHPIGFGHHFGDALGHPFGALGRPAGIDQQGKLIAAQARQLVPGFELALEPRHHLQDQTVARLMAEGIVGMTKIVQVQMAEGQATAFVFCQPGGQQGLEALTVGNTGERVLLGQALQGVFQHAALAHMAQAAAQGVGVQCIRHQPIADTQRRHQWLLLQQQYTRQAAPAGAGLQAGRGQ